MLFDTSKIFIDYSRELKNTLDSHGIAVGSLIEAYLGIKKSLTKRLSEKQYQQVENILESGIEEIQSGNKILTPLMQVPSKVLVQTKDYLHAMLEGNNSGAQYVIQQGFVEGLTLVDMEVGIVQPAMYQIGELWQNNRITVAQEHLATAVSEKILAQAFSQADFKNPVDKKVVCACVEGNYHCLGLRMIADAYETSGWDVAFLGANTPCNSILAMLDNDKVDALALSVSMAPQLFLVRRLIDQLKADIGSKMPAIILGGIALNQYRGLSPSLKIDQYYTDAKDLYDDL
jgi:methanogenic corrinoid protein MtbC1